MTAKTPLSLQSLAPYIAQIVAAEIPTFTSKLESTATEDSVNARQVKELPTATAQDAEPACVSAEKSQ